MAEITPESMALFHEQNRKLDEGVLARFTPEQAIALLRLVDGSTLDQAIARKLAQGLTDPGVVH